MTVVGVRLERGGTLSFYDAGDEEFEAGDFALVETAAGPATGRVAVGTRQILESALGGLPTVGGRALRGDLKRLEAHRAREADVLRLGRERAAALGVVVSLVAAEVAFDGSRVGLSYEAAEAIDLRVLSRDLAGRLGAEVEMRQVDLVDGPPPPGRGRCGRDLCCAGFLDARAATPEAAGGHPAAASASGCGRLLCYLVDAPLVPSGRDLPRSGEALALPDGGRGIVVGYRPLEETVALRDPAGDIVTLPLGAVLPEGGSSPEEAV